MATKPNGNICLIREQIIEDPVSGLTLQFEYRDNGTSKLTIYGDLPFGSREIIFDENGEEAAAGTAITGPCRASWLRKVKA